MRSADTSVDTPLAGSWDRAGRTRYAFTDRAQGNVSHEVGEGDVSLARAAALALVEARPDDAVFMEQVHGGTVAVVGAADRGRGLGGRAGAVPGVDALVTFDPGVALAVLVADCVPVLLADPLRAVAAVHAGRAGVRAGVVAAAVEALAPDTRSTIRAVIGPGIGGCCYEVPAELRDDVSAVAPAAWAVSRAGRPALDLPAAVRAQLTDAGVTRIEQVGSCTRCDHDRWFSHRAAAAGRPGGRQAGLVNLAPAGAGRLRRGAHPAP